MICLFHSNELPLRHQFNVIDGATTGPGAHAGVFGKVIAHYETLPICNFEIISLPKLKGISYRSD
jgi:hypothetical protein